MERLFYHVGVYIVRNGRSLLVVFSRVAVWITNQSSLCDRVLLLRLQGNGRFQLPVPIQPCLEVVYSTGALDEPIEFAGDVTARLFVSSDTVDADWVVKLVDVHADGFSQNLAVGILRGRFRNSEMVPELLIPGKIYEIKVDLGPVAAQIGKNYCLQVDICGSYFPLFDRNTNTGEGPFSTETKIATERVYHVPEMSSCVILPIRN